MSRSQDSGSRSCPAVCRTFHANPLLSLRPESFPPGLVPWVTPSAAPAFASTLSRLSGPRGPLCLRDSGGGCSFGVPGRTLETLPRGLFLRLWARDDAASLGVTSRRCQRIRGDRLTRRVILQLG